MKNTAVNSIKYTGIVTLSQYIGSKKVKLAQIQNEGSYSLFNFFSDCLLGDFDVARINRPTKIMLLSYITRDDQGKEIPPYYRDCSGFIYLLSRPEKVSSSGKSTVHYSFVITRDILEGAAFDSIGLYADSENNPENYAAIAKVSNLNLPGLSTSSALVVDWELNISNKDKEIV